MAVECYSACVNLLFGLNIYGDFAAGCFPGPLIINTAGDKPLKEDYHTAQLLGLILELLSFCVEHHTYHIKNFILQKDLLERILVLMKSNHTFLVLGALRFVRKAIAMKDEFYNRRVIFLIGPIGSLAQLHNLSGRVSTRLTLRDKLGEHLKCI